MEANSNIGLRLLLLAALTAINGFFAASEIALLSARRPRLKQLAADGNLGAIAALKLLANMERLLSVVQVGIGITSLAMGVAGEEAINHWLKLQLVPLAPAGYAKVVEIFCLMVSFVCLTLLLVVVGEVVPKNLGIIASERVSLLGAPVLLLVNRALSPLVFLVESLANFFSRILGLPRGTAHGVHSPEEIRHIVESSKEHSTVTPFEAHAIDRLLELRELVAREVMTPRNSLICLPINASLDNLLKVMSDHHFSRVPVYKDNPDNIMGIVHFRDLLVVWQERRLSTERRRPVRPFRLENYIRKLPVIPETKSLSDLIDEFRQNRAHMSLVVNEFGAVSGVLTLEDVFEQVFGEINDEHDLVVAEVETEADDLELDGSTTARDLELKFGIELPNDAGFETLAGFILFRLGFIPKSGEVVEEGDRRYTVVEMERNRIGRVRVERIRHTDPV
ncbi:hemolysin family protein [Bryobacter aggregatus]|uniref:hemolysin family protein n=1 Tax=Bryobacter aggregatus TaxID=360054 RepID=UPI0004E2318C|nr:hemolysin family protein [Bryobacter aggregatus]